MASSASWIGDKHAAAVLFYAQSHDTTIGTKGTMGPGTNSKILWLVAGNPPGPLTVKGTNLSTGTQVRQSFSGSGDFPSIPVLPDPGCWQLTALIGSKIVLQMTVLAEDKTASTPTTQTPPERAGCIETKGVANVLSGPVQAGPFEANRHHWTRPGGTKFWVAATSPQGRRGATIRATHTGEKNTRVMVRRGPDDRAELPGDPNPPAEFYPGALRLPSAGTWRLTITIGSATDCFLVTVPRR